MAQLVLGGAGAFIGGLIGGPIGAQIGWAIGSAVGASTQTIQGPRIGEIARQSSQEGVPRPIVFALSPPITGNIIDTSEPRIVTSTHGGKGGPKVESESVFRTYAIGVCEGPIVCFVRVWRNGTLVYDARPPGEGSGADRIAMNAKFLEKARFFTGDWDQAASPDLEALHGAGTTPSYRGTAYMVIADEDLTDMRGAIPQYVFQVTGLGGVSEEEFEEPGVRFQGEHEFPVSETLPSMTITVDSFDIPPDTLADGDLLERYTLSFLPDDFPSGSGSTMLIRMFFGLTPVTVWRIVRTSGFAGFPERIELSINGVLDVSSGLFQIGSGSIEIIPHEFVPGTYDITLENTSIPLNADLSAVGTSVGIQTVQDWGTASRGYMTSEIIFTGIRGDIQCTAFTMPLAMAVNAICGRAGLPEPDTSLLSGFLRGFTVTNTYPCYAALKALSEIFLFDVANYDSQIRFIPRGANSVVTISEDDLVDDGNEIDEEKRGDPISIPRVLHLNYHDVDGGLNTDKQTSERSGDRRSVGEVSLQTAVVLNADEAARAVAINHKVLTEDQRGELKLSLPDSFLFLAPSNPIIVQRPGKSERCRITRCDIQDGYQEYALLRDRQSSYTSNVEGIPAAPQTEPPSSIVGPTLIEILDIPLLRDADDAIGLAYYVAISGVLDAWQGATIELSLDGGANYIDQSTFTAATVMGETTTELSDHPQEFPDETSTVGVRIDTPDGELLETDLIGLLNRENMALIGDEIIQFAIPEETSEGSFNLSYFLRGRKGTQTAQHAAGSRFVLLQRSSLALVPAELLYLGRTLTFRATSFGAAPETGTVTSFVFAGKTQVERSPAYLQAHRSGSDIEVTWQGVGRLGGGAMTAHGSYFLGYVVTVSDGVLTETIETLDQALTHDISGFTGPITISVEQRNHLTGLGPSIEVIV